MHGQQAVAHACDILTLECKKEERKNTHNVNGLNVCTGLQSVVARHNKFQLNFIVVFWCNDLNSNKYMNTIMLKLLLLVALVSTVFAFDEYINHTLNRPLIDRVLLRHKIDDILRLDTANDDYHQNMIQAAEHRLFVNAGIVYFYCTFNIPQTFISFISYILYYRQRVGTISITSWR
jgi:hypothetical protein